MHRELCLPALSGTRASAAPAVELARCAERCGYRTVWAPELLGTDPYGLLGWVGSQTERIRLGCAVAQISARAAVTTAACAATLDVLSGGRFQLGIGVSGPRVTESLHGRGYRRPLLHLREYVEVLRAAMSGEPIIYQGQTITLPATSGSEPMAPLELPLARRVPVHTAGLGPEAVRLAGELADGLITIHCPPAYMATAGTWLQEGAARSGRSLEGFAVRVMVHVTVDEDLELARDITRPLLALYLGGMGTKRTNFYNRLAGRLGFADEAARVQDAFLGADLGEAIDLISDAMLDSMTVCGPPERVAARLAEYRDAGVDGVIVGVCGSTIAQQMEQIEQIAALWPAGLSRPARSPRL